MELNIENEEFAIACKEVLEILNNIKEEDVKKIPKEKIEKLKFNAKQDYVFVYNVHKDVKEQNISKCAKAIMANFFIDYIASPRQKEKLL